MEWLNPAVIVVYLVAMVMFGFWGKRRTKTFRLSCGRATLGQYFIQPPSSLSFWAVHQPLVVSGWAMSTVSPECGWLPQLASALSF